MRRVGPARLDQEVSSAQLTFRRVGRHVKWISRFGLSSLVEEDRLDLRRRLRIEVQRQVWAWRRRGGRSATTVVYLLGVQRSGTNMLTRAIEELPFFKVYHENHARMFRRFMLLSGAEVETEIRRAGMPFVLIKAISDSHRAAELLAAERARGRLVKVIWLYRDYAARAESAVAKFGDDNLRVLTAIASGHDARLWQSKGLTPESKAAVRAAVDAGLDQLTAAALFWQVRNQLYFDLGLDRDPDVLLVRYERLVEQPEAELRRVCAFLGVEYEERLADDIEVRSQKKVDVAIAPSVKDLCEALVDRLDDASRRSVALVEDGGLADGSGLSPDEMLA